MIVGVCSEGAIPGELLSCLNFVFKHHLFAAFDIIDRRGVLRFTSPKGRVLFQACIACTYAPSS